MASVTDAFDTDGARAHPATGTVTGEVVEAAVASASRAGVDWRESSLSRRAAVLFAFRALVHEHR